MPEYNEHDLRRYSNPDTFFDGVIDVFEDVAEPVPPGTKAPPRPPGKERIPEARPDATIPELITRMEYALEVFHNALAEIKRIHGRSQSQSQPPQEPPQSKAG